MSTLKIKLILMVFGLAALFAIVVTSRQTHAQDNNGNPSNWCRNGLFPSDSKSFRIGRVVSAPQGKLHFLGDENDCPKQNDAQCVLKSYLIIGNSVLISRDYNSWACSWYQPTRGRETVGWLPLENLKIEEPNQNPSVTRWIGNWRSFDDTLKIQPVKGSGGLQVDGDAMWRGLGDNVHTGNVSAAAKPTGNHLELSDGDCQVTLTLVNEFLIASDNSNCGGANVRFDGVYRRR